MLEYNKMYLITNKRNAKILTKEFLDYYVGFLQDVRDDIFYIAYFDSILFGNAGILYTDISKEDLEEFYDITEIKEMDEQIISFRESLHKFKNVSDICKKNIIKERGIE